MEWNWRKFPASTHGINGCSIITSFMFVNQNTVSTKPHESITPYEVPWMPSEMDWIPMQFNGVT